MHKTSVVIPLQFDVEPSSSSSSYQNKFKSLLSNVKNYYKQKLKTWLFESLLRQYFVFIIGIWLFLPCFTSLLP